MRKSQIAQRLGRALRLKFCQFKSGVGLVLFMFEKSQKLVQVKHLNY